MRIYLLIPLVALLAGCESLPKQPAPAETAPVVRTPPPPPPPVAVETKEPVHHTPAALQARDTLLRGELEYEQLARSAFRDLPSYTTLNSSGIILRPKETKQRFAVIKGYKITRIETHPLTDGRLRVWFEVENVSTKQLYPEAGVEFRPAPEGQFTKFKLLPPVAPNQKFVTYFESTQALVESYSILLRNSR